MLERPDTWNVMFLDFDHEHFMEHLHLPSVNIIVPDRSMCCRFLRQPVDSDSCNCREDLHVINVAVQRLSK